LINSINAGMVIIISSMPKGATLEAPYISKI